jgi:capsular exopolysaccharide synthesis family protein
VNRDTVSEKTKKFLKSLNPAYVVHSKPESDCDARLLSITDPLSTLSEQYKAICSKILFLSSQRELKTILITSCQPKEGKTITACNLAATLARYMKKKVALIDVDLRRPSVHVMFQISRKPGLSDILLEKDGGKKFGTPPVKHGVHIIPAGTFSEDPGVLYSSPKLQSLLTDLRSKFDYVILDAPPVLNVTDASVVGAACDAVFFVVKAQVTPQAMIEEAMARLEGTQANPLAVILTNVSSTPEYYSYFTNKHYRTYYQHRYVPYGKIELEDTKKPTANGA